jgi:molybdopterin/thiamine biosynthesis adenylyltransferase
MNKTDLAKYRSRFASISWAKPALQTNVLIVGIGGIGSWLSLFLARIGYNLIIVDKDKLEEHNIGGQLYLTAQAQSRSFKAYAAYELLKQFTGRSDLTTIVASFDTYHLRGQHIVAACVDNMAARKQILENFKAVPDSLPLKLLVDGRLSAEQFQVYFVTKDRIEEYEKTLFDDSLLPDEPCTNKATSHFGAGIAYVMTKGINNYLAIKAGEPRELPFMVKEEGFLFTQNIL